MSEVPDNQNPHAQPPQAWGPRPAATRPPQPRQWGEAQQAPPPIQPSAESPAPPKKRRRVFFWFFLAVQILFLVWVIAGAASGNGTPESCSGLTGDNLKTCQDAGDVGTTIGVGLIIGLWVATDFILALTYVIYRFATRQQRA
ncbi:hypothetical protein [Streptomyces rhizosphaerihabitans]|uniref:hypothetical protein n=1 Tax=Streptomyces rhizosphaerihabitans TaxID=1266770 RepID=UPI0021C24678|nr:hypothetical protein [Streptomyces rhizosphaerihabitans]MCT9008319.1 hypothetical protein [Streptomyces rhizosphaerihabitans]